MRPAFLAAVALVAAAVGNILVESLSDTGIFGSAYHDTDHASVLPTLGIGVLFALVVVVARARRASRRDWLIETARDFTVHAPVRAFAPVYAMQLALVFAMENAESLLGGDGFVTGLGWLGAPPLISLLLHALIGALALLMLGRLMRALTRSLVLLIHGTVELILVLARGETSLTFVRRAARRPRFGRTAPYAQRLGGRAPPSLPTPA